MLQVGIRTRIGILTNKMTFLSNPFSLLEHQEQLEKRWEREKNPQIIKYQGFCFNVLSRTKVGIVFTFFSFHKFR